MGVQCYKEYVFCKSDMLPYPTDGGEGAQAYCNCLSADCAPKVDEHFGAEDDYTSNTKCSDFTRSETNSYWDGEKSELMTKLLGVLVVPDLDVDIKKTAEALVNALEVLDIATDGEAIQILATALDGKISAGQGIYSKVLDIDGVDLAAIADSIGKDTIAASLLVADDGVVTVGFNVAAKLYAGVVAALVAMVTPYMF